MPLGAMPSLDALPPLPMFTGAQPGPSGLDLLASAATAKHHQQPPVASGIARLTGPGPYNPAASLPPKIVKKILDLEFVEMAELKADIWVEEPSTGDSGHARRQSGKPPVTDIKVWLECFARMAAILVMRFPEKGPELWAYQTSILRAAHNYEGANWVAYDRQFRRDMLAWSTPNTRLYNEAFTGRAKMIPRCPHCLCEDHAGASCPHNPNPVIWGWLPNPSAGQVPPLTQPQISQGWSQPGPTICRNYNDNRCRFARCRYQHICLECLGPHPAATCPRRVAVGPPPVRSRQPTRGRMSQGHPYAAGPRR